MRKSKTIRVANVPIPIEEKIHNILEKQHKDYKVIKGKLRSSERTLICVSYIDKLEQAFKDTDLRRELNTEYPVLIVKSMPNKSLSALTARGAVRVFFSHKCQKDALAQEIVTSIEEIIELDEIYGRPDNIKRTSMGRALDSLNLGVSIIDRSFHVWYRNTKHHEIVPKLSGKEFTPICWIDSHGRTEQTKPCNNCAAKRVFECSSFLSARTNLAIGCERNSRQPARLTEVQAFPIVIKINDKDRCIGCIEYVEDVTDNVFFTSTMTQESLKSILKGLLKISILPDFNRARLFRLSKDRFHGFISVSRENIPKMPVFMESLCFENTAKTFHTVPTIRNIDDLCESEAAYNEVLDKKNAPTWIELPIYGKDNSPIGKLVLDRWNDKKTEKIREDEKTGYDNLVKMLARLLEEPNMLKELQNRDQVTTAPERIFKEDLHSFDAIYNQLVKELCALDGVVSSFIRIPIVSENDILLKKCYGSGAYYDHGKNIWSVKKDDSLSVKAFKNNKPSPIIHTFKLHFENVSKISEIKNRKEQAELKTIVSQQSFPLGRKGYEPLAVLSVQCSHPSVLFDECIQRLVTIANASLTEIVLRQFNNDMRVCLLSALELHDVETALHSKRVGCLSKLIAERIDNTHEEKKILGEKAYLAGCLHDIGKIGLSHNLIRGAFKPTHGEWIYLRAHVDLSTEIMNSMGGMQDICIAVGEHHKWFNGISGYPRLEAGKQDKESQVQWGKDISLLGRIIAVADSFEAMSSPGRLYRKESSYAASCTELNRHKGTQFCPEILDIFNEAYNQNEVENILKEKFGY